MCKERGASPSRVRGPELTQELKLGRLHYRQVPRLRAFKNAADIDGGLAISIRDTGAVAGKPARHDIFARDEDRRNCVTNGQRGDLSPSRKQERIGAGEQRPGAQLNQRSKGSVDLAFAAGVQHVELES